MLLLTGTISIGNVILSISMMTIIFLSFLYILHLRSIVKHDKVLFTLCNYRRSIMELMRSERFTQEKISSSDYKTLRFLLDKTNKLIAIYSKRYTTTFHIKNFSRFIKSLYIQASEIEKEKKGYSFLSESKNEEIGHMKEEFASMVPWIVISHLPTLFKTTIALMVPTVALARIFGSKANSMKNFITYVKRNLNNPSTKKFDINYQ